MLSSYRSHDKSMNDGALGISRKYLRMFGVRAAPAETMGWK
jgi:hypothetical protein